MLPLLNVLLLLFLIKFNNILPLSPVHSIIFLKPNSFANNVAALPRVYKMKILF